MEIVKLPKKFRDACELIRNTSADPQTVFANFKGFDNQIKAVCAEVAYFNENYQDAFDYDVEVMPYWDEWHYSNSRLEHMQAMVFASKKLGNEQEFINVINAQLLDLDSKVDYPDHIKTTIKKMYGNCLEKLQNQEVYQEFKECESPELYSDIIKEFESEKRDLNASKNKLLLMSRLFDKGSAKDGLSIYEEICDDNLSTMWHLKAMEVYSYYGFDEKCREIILRMTKQRLWLVATATQVRPMEFFIYPIILKYLDSAMLEEIRNALILD